MFIYFWGVYFVNIQSFNPPCLIYKVGGKEHWFFLNKENSEWSKYQLPSLADAEVRVTGSAWTGHQTPCPSSRSALRGGALRWALQPLQNPSLSRGMRGLHLRLAPPLMGFLAFDESFTFPELQFPYLRLGWNNSYPKGICVEKMKWCMDM